MTDDEKRIAALEAEIADLRKQVDHLTRQFAIVASQAAAAARRK